MDILFTVSMETKLVETLNFVVHNVDSLTLVKLTEFWFRCDKRVPRGLMVIAIGF